MYPNHLDIFALQYEAYEIAFQTGKISINGQGHFKEKLTLELNDAICYEFYMTGCQGEEGSAQARVTQAMNQRIVQSATSQKYGLLLGDNFYTAGVTKANDHKFRTQFSQLYTTSIKWFAALGNHDWNMQNKILARIQEIYHPNITKLQRAMFQVKHTYLAVDQWCMPFRYYVIAMPYANFFILDSNTFYWDKTQQCWFIERYKTLNPPGTSKKNLIAMHHPVESIGKRHKMVGHTDIQLYHLPGYPSLDKHSTYERQHCLSHLLLDKFVEIRDSLNLNMSKVFIDAFFSAHDHFLASYFIKWLENCVQYIIGGGGGKLQDRKILGPKMEFHPNYGFAKLTIGSTGFKTELIPVY